MKKLIYFIFAAALFSACSEKEGLVEALEIGVKDKNPVVGCEAGKYFLKVLSDGEFTARLDSENWISFESTPARSISASGDVEIPLVYEINHGIMRQTTLTLVRGRRSVEVVLSQNGVLSSDISFPNHSVTIDATGGRGAAKVLSVYKDEELEIELAYENVSGWISNISKVNNFIGFDVIENGGESNRSAIITVSSKKDPSIRDAVQIVQLGSSVEVEEVSFQTVRDLLSKNDTIRIDRSYLIEGYVSGTDIEGNGGENLNYSSSIQDLTFSSRTAYVQNEDGSLGFRVIFDTPEDNITTRYDKIKILLSGTLLKRMGGVVNDPLRYDILSVRRSNILALEEGTSYNIPEKVKTISQLTPNDVYTYVTLTDCQIPVRKGPFVPIDIRHTHVIHSYPMVVLDKEGCNTHIMTNLSASWQRDGKGLPQGSGNISGVIVHETCDNFEWDTDAANRKIQEGVMPDYITGIGNIGSFQIRPFTKEEIALSENFEDGFTEMIMEVRYYNKSNEQIVKNVGGNTLYSTYPAVPDPLHSTDVKGWLQAADPFGNSAAVASFRDWTHIGPMSNGEITEPANGNGVVDFYGVKSEWEPYSTVSTTALIMKSSAWYASNNWWTNGSFGKSWMASFSTIGLTDANFPFSVQLGVYNGLGQTVGAPRYWTVEYSTDSENWQYAGEYTVPDFPILSNRKAWQCPGPKYVSITLPEDYELLDKTQVFVRMHPSSSSAGEPGSYDGGTIVSGRESCLNYFAIRYNR